MMCRYMLHTHSAMMQSRLEDAEKQQLRRCVRALNEAHVFLQQTFLAAKVSA